MLTISDGGIIQTTFRIGRNSCKAQLYTDVKNSFDYDE